MLFMLFPLSIFSNSDPATRLFFLSSLTIYCFVSFLFFLYTRILFSVRISFSLLVWSDFTFPSEHETICCETKPLSPTSCSNRRKENFRIIFPTIFELSNLEAFVVSFQNCSELLVCPELSFHVSWIYPCPRTSVKS